MLRPAAWVAQDAASIAPAERPRRSIVTPGLRGISALTLKVRSDHGPWPHQNIPDILQMDYRYIYEYARRGALLPLDDYMPSVLNIADFGKDAIDSGRVDGKIYGVSLGLNSTAVLYSKTAFAAARAEAATYETSWAEYPAIFAELTKAANREGFWAARMPAARRPRSRSGCASAARRSTIRTAKLGFGAGEAGEWLAFWDDMRKRKACVPADVQALDAAAMDSSMMSLGKAATAFQHSNLLVTFQTLSKDSLAMTMYPQWRGGVKPGQYLKPSQMLSVYARTKFAPEAARIVNFFVEDSEAAKILSVERGVPASAAMRKADHPELNELDQQSIVYISMAIGARRAAAGAAAQRRRRRSRRTLRRINEEVGFARLTLLRRQAVRRRGEVDSRSRLRRDKPCARPVPWTVSAPSRRSGRCAPPLVAGGARRLAGLSLPAAVVPRVLWPHCRADPRLALSLLHQLRLVQSPRWIGAANYIRIATSDVNFIAAMKVTFLYVALAVPFKLGFALAVAMALNKGIRGLPLYRAIFYLPSLLGASVAIAVLWRTLFSGDGLVNKVLALVGIHGPSWIFRSDLRDLHPRHAQRLAVRLADDHLPAGLRQIPRDVSRRRASKAPQNGGSSARSPAAAHPGGCSSTPSSRRSTPSRPHPRLHHQRGHRAAGARDLVYTLISISRPSAIPHGLCRGARLDLVIIIRAVHRLLVPHRALLGALR